MLLNRGFQRLSTNFIVRVNDWRIRIRQRQQEYPGSRHLLAPVDARQRSVSGRRWRIRAAAQATIHFPGDAKLCLLFGQSEHSEKNCHAEHETFAQKQQPAGR